MLSTASEAEQPRVSWLKNNIRLAGHINSRHFVASAHVSSQIPSGTFSMLFRVLLFHVLIVKNFMGMQYSFSAY